MANVDQETLELFSKRSNRTVVWMTVGFAVGGCVLEMTTGALSFALKSFLPAGILAVWLPFCFITIPPLHYLCRYVVRLESRVRQLEERLNLRDPA